LPGFLLGFFVVSGLGICLLGEGFFIFLPGDGFFIFFPGDGAFLGAFDGEPGLSGFFGN
jgi:hypothetical protein